jgi:hypothetical protein
VQNVLQRRRQRAATFGCGLNPLAVGLAVYGLSRVIGEPASSTKLRCSAGRDGARPDLDARVDRESRRSPEARGLALAAKVVPGEISVNAKKRPSA